MISIVDTGAALGAEIRGVDLTRPLDESTAAGVRAAFYRYEVIFIRGQPMSDDDQIRFSTHFGEVRRIKFTQMYSGGAKPKPEIFIVSNIVHDGQHIGSYDAGLFWHTDGAYLEKPHSASLLRALEIPEEGGRTLGDTRFASMSAAYNALPQSMKRRLDGLKALHSVMLRFKKTVESGIEKEEFSDDIKKDTDAVHPVVRVHPGSGRKCLFVSEGYTMRILDMPDDESRELLAELTAHCVKPEFQYLHNWRKDDLIVWDDCATQHKATFDYALPKRRLMHRTTVG